MKRIMPIGIAAIALASATPAVVAADTARFVGTAKPVGGGEPIYQEIHEVKGLCTEGFFQPQSHSVAYRRNASGEFADKTLNYESSPLRPTVRFSQPEFNEQMNIRNDAEQLMEIEWKTPEGDTKNFTVDVSSALVADAGFDNFVRRNWSSVVKQGESVEFDILAPTRGDYYGFVLEPAEDKRINAEHQVRIKPSSTLMGFLVDPILLGYNSDGMLTDYLGLTNIRKDEDSNFVAHIRYDIEKTPDCELTR